MIVKNYKITLYKFNQALTKDGSLKYWVEKYILQNISDIDNIVMIFNQFTLIACWLLAQLYNCKLFVVCCLYSLSLFILSHW